MAFKVACEQISKFELGLLAICENGAAVEVMGVLFSFKNGMVGSQDAFLLHESIEILGSVMLGEGEQENADGCAR